MLVKNKKRDLGTKEENPTSSKSRKKLYFFEKNSLQIFAKNKQSLTFAFAFSNRPGGGIGRRAGFKIQFWQQSAGSIPAPGTNREKAPATFAGAFFMC